MTRRPDGAAEALQALHEGLAALEDAVRRGDLHALAQIETAIEAASQQLGAQADGSATGRLSSSQRAALGQLRATVRRLTPMLTAAHQGVAAARARLQDVARAREGLGTYDRLGARQVLTASGATRRPNPSLAPATAEAAQPVASRPDAPRPDAPRLDASRPDAPRVDAFGPAAGLVQDSAARHATAPTAPIFRLKPAAG